MTISKKLVLFLIFLSVCSWSEWNKHYSGIDRYIFPGGRLMRELEDFTCMIIFFLISPLPSPPHRPCNILSTPSPAVNWRSVFYRPPLILAMTDPPPPPLRSFPFHPKPLPLPHPYPSGWWITTDPFRTKTLTFYIYLLARIGLKYLEFRSFP